jgi:glutamine amidotransferase
MITIVNYGSGNSKAIGNIYERLRISFRIANNPEEIKGSEKIILPGVGAFDETVAMLNDAGFRPVLDHAVLIDKIPVLGICVGMQILAQQSEEGNLPGLGWIDGAVKKIDKSTLTHKPKLPHLGWNSIRIKRQSPLFESLNEEDGFYFLHSYHFQCDQEENILTTTYYGSELVSAVNKENIFGVQFHPEKSHHNGIQLLKNFAEL